MRKKKNEYIEVYGYDEEDSRNYEEFDDTEDAMDEAIARLRGTISVGDCMECGAKDAMKYEGNVCFVCSKCKMAVHENLYYLWTAGFPIEDADQY